METMETMGDYQHAPNETIETMQTIETMKTISDYQHTQRLYMMTMGD